MDVFIGSKCKIEQMGVFAIVLRKQFYVTFDLVNLKGGVSLPLLELRVSSFRLNVLFDTYNH